METVPTVNASPELSGQLLALEFAIIGLMAISPERPRLLAALEKIALESDQFFTDTPERKAKTFEALRERMAFYVAASGGASGTPQ